MPRLLFQLPSKIYIQFQVPCLVLSSGQDLPRRNHMNSWALVLCSWARLISTSAQPLTDVAPGCFWREEDRERRQRNSDPNAGIIFNSVHLFPNPAHQRLQVNMPGNPDIGTLHIFNALGELIMILGVASEEESTTINISDLPSGIYFVRLDRGGQNIFSEKLVIQP